MFNVFKQFRMSTFEPALLKSKFKGCLLGSVVGDCLGSPFEGDIISPGDKIVIQKYFDTLGTADLKGPVRCYTDDTAMMKSVAKSLIENPEIDYNHMAKLFVKEYFTEPNRGYGQNIVDVFEKLRKRKFDDIYKPALEQFSGSGSYGNGGAMRIAPIALYFCDNYDAMIEGAKKSTQITHTNSLGVHGAVLQCLAVHQAMAQDATTGINPDEFLDSLINKIRAVEKENDDGLELNDCYPYAHKLNSVKKYLKKSYYDELDDEIIVDLGNSVSAYESVPTAIYCFLRSLGEIPTINTDNTFRRTIQYAISLGGDTDTIACMSGAIAGAYLGEESINKNMAKQCETYKTIIELAEQLYNAAVK